MCGIAGILAFSSSATVADEELMRLIEAMPHRGPDGNGKWLSDDRKVGLSHLRLAIVDLSDEAAQPMRDSEGTIWLTYNGEIYNHLELRRELQAAGYTFRTDHSDTEVLIHGYKEWGVDGLVSRLVGMFAFAIWDVRKKRLTVVRDRVGIKPVYFTRAGGRFIFGSEIKALMTVGDVPREVNGTAIAHYLSFMVAPAPLTMFRGVFKLPAGHILEVEADGTARARRYWDALPGKSGVMDEVRGLSPAAQGDFFGKEILRRLETAIDRRMMSDVPFGVFLSGGIDSSANVALMSRISNRPVKTFTIGFSDHTHLNELEYADRVAKEFSTDHHEIRVNGADMRGYLNDLIVSQDEPISDWVCVPLYFVSKLAKDSGVTVVQVGEGSDEQFAGYDSYMKYLKLHDRMGNGALKSLIGAASPLLGALARAMPGRRSVFEQAFEISRRINRGHELFYGGSNAFWAIHVEKYLDASGISPDPGDIDTGVDGLELDSVGSSDSGDIVDAFARNIVACDADADVLARMIHAEFRLRLPELLLMRVDKITMSTSIEARVPFLDHELVDLTMDIPRNIKVDGYKTKHLLKNALRGVIPDEIIDRKKMGFAAPAAEWLREDFGNEAEGMVLGSPLAGKTGPLNGDAIRRAFDDHRAGRKDNALHLWVLLNLTAWHDHWIGGA
ncbi:MAG: asparagine synthase (glutamine-hydrolyzing) [Rhodospirillales bacterium]|nr:asparagine synthase (glutamine-hydrolyzing) [Rhodospirillales bacterium]MBO6785995.1 asparagine synthase (glutamine-hydrolyzing) [Rhodospirillales bacterium]